MTRLSDMLVYLRAREGLSQRELAKILGVSRSAIGMYETSKREPDLDSGSSAHYGRAGSSPASRTMKKPCILNRYRAFLFFRTHRRHTMKHHQTPYNWRIKWRKNNLKILRKTIDIYCSTGLTQKAFAALTGIPQRTIEGWEAGDREPPGYVITLLAYFLTGEKLINE